MKTIPLLVPLLGAVLMATAAEPPKTDSTAPTTELSATKDSLPASPPVAALTMADRQSLQKVGERIALSGALTKAPPSKARTVGQLFNPLAPVQPQPQTRWLERTAWSTAASTAGARSGPVEKRHEPQFGVFVASK